jgi:hypothetical protein
MKRLKWTDKKITKAIRRVMNHLKIDNMPSKTEIEYALGDKALTNAIVKHGGFGYWADKLGLERSSSTTKKAFHYEKQAQRILLEKTGYEFELTMYKHPYDLYCKGVKIDVKVVERKYKSHNRTNYCHEFTNQKNPSTCDFFMLICNNAKVIDKILIVPAIYFNDKHIIHVSKDGKMSDSYNYFVDRYEYITDLIDYNKKMRKKIRFKRPEF